LMNGIIARQLTYVNNALGAFIDIEDYIQVGTGDDYVRNHGYFVAELDGKDCLVRRMPFTTKACQNIARIQHLDSNVFIDFSTKDDLCNWHINSYKKSEMEYCANGKIGVIERIIDYNPTGYAREYNERCMTGERFPPIPTILRRGQDHIPEFYADCGNFIIVSRTKRHLLNYLKGWVMERTGVLHGKNNTLSVFKPKGTNVELLSMPGISNSCAHNAYVFYQYMLNNRVAQCHLSLLKGSYDKKTYTLKLQAHADTVTAELLSKSYIIPGQTPPRLNSEGLIWAEVVTLANCLKIQAVRVPRWEDMDKLDKVDSIVVSGKHAYLYLPNIALQPMLTDLKRRTIVSDYDEESKSEDEEPISFAQVQADQLDDAFNMEDKRINHKDKYVKQDFDSTSLFAKIKDILPFSKDECPIVEGPRPKRGKAISFKNWGTNFHPNFDVNLNFKYGDYAEKRIKDLYPVTREHRALYEKRDQKPYGHPFLRTIADQKYIDVVNTLNRNFSDDFSKVSVIDIGAKIHKFDDYTFGSVKKETFKYKAYRPKLNAYDENYYVKHNEYAKYLVDEAVKADTKDDGNFIICIDAIWYDGVKEYIAAKLNEIPGSVAHVTFTAYPSIPGTYAAFDNEATAVIKDNKIVYQAKDNARYEHSHFPWPSVDSTEAVMEFDSKRVSIYEASRTSVGPQLSIVHTVWTATKMPLKNPDFEQVHSYEDISFEDMNIVNKFKGIIDSFDIETFKNKMRVLKTVNRAVYNVSISNVVAKDPMTMVSAATREYASQGGFVTNEIKHMVGCCVLARLPFLDAYKATYAVISDNNHAKLSRAIKEADKPIKERFVNMAADFGMRTLGKILPSVKLPEIVNKASIDGIGLDSVKEPELLSFEVDKPTLSWKQRIAIIFVAKEKAQLEKKYNEKYVCALAVDMQSEAAFEAVNIVFSASLSVGIATYLGMPHFAGMVGTLGVIALLYEGYRFVKASMLLTLVSDKVKYEVFTRIHDEPASKLMLRYSEGCGSYQRDTNGSYVTHVEDHLLAVKPSDLGQQAISVTFSNSILQAKWDAGELRADDVPCTCKLDNYISSMPEIIANGEPHRCRYYDGCARNGVAALLLRQLQKCPHGDPRWFEKFYSWLDMRLDELYDMTGLIDFKYTFEEYLSSRKPQKAKKYADAANEVLQTGRMIDSLNFFVKSGEAKYGEGKPRAIMATHRTGSGYALYFSWLLKKLLGKLLPGLVFDMNCADLSDRMTEDLLHIPNRMPIDKACTVARDGQNHDAHQNGLIMAVHNHIINKFFSFIVDAGNIPENIHAELKRFMLNNHHKAYYLLNSTDPFMIVEFMNTVTSGMGVHTTTLNSAWVHLSNEYMSHTAGLVYDIVYFDANTNAYRYGKGNDIYNYAHGDDSLMKVVTSFGVRNIKQVIMNTYSIDNNCRMKGTGESIKTLDIMPFDYMDFLSLHSIRLLNGQFVIFRQLHKALLVKPRNKKLDYYEHLYGVYMAYSVWGKNVPLITDMIKYMSDKLASCKNPDGTLGYKPSPKRQRAIDVFVESYEVAMLKTHAHLIDTDATIEMWETMYKLPTGLAYKIDYNENNCTSQIYDYLYNKIGGNDVEVVREYDVARVDEPVSSNLNVIEHIIIKNNQNNNQNNHQMSTKINTTINPSRPQRSFRPRKGNKQLNNKSLNKALRALTGAGGTLGPKPKFRTAAQKEKRRLRNQRRKEKRFGQPYSKVGGQYGGPTGLKTTTEHTDTACYVKAVLDPYNAEPCRVPTEFPVKSACTKFWYTGKFSTNANGDFQLIATPNNMMGPGILYVANDNTYVSATGVQGPPIVVLENGGTKLPTSAYSAGRVVGSSLRVWSVNAKNYLAGYNVASSVPRSPVSVLAAGSPSFIETELENEGTTTEIDDPHKKTQILYRPRDYTDLNYQSTASATNSSSMVYAGYGNLNSLTNGPSVFKYEYCIIYDYLASSSNYLSAEQVGPSDMEGVSIASYLFAEKPELLAGDVKPEGWLNETLDYISDKASDIPFKKIGQTILDIMNASMSNDTFNIAGSILNGVI